MIHEGILAGGGGMHADCEATRVEHGSHPDDIWGANGTPASRQTTFESLINIRPRQNNRSMTIADPALRERVAHVVHNLLRVA